MKLVWEDGYSTGVKIIDEQHQRLFDITNSLHDGMAAGSPGLLVPEVLRELADYASYHFETEESLMEETAYPDLEKHRREHNDFLAQVMDLNDQLGKSQLFLSLDIISFLVRWIENHVKKVDFLLGRYLCARNGA